MLFRLNSSRLNSLRLTNSKVSPCVHSAFFRDLSKFFRFAIWYFCACFKTFEIASITNKKACT